MNRISSVAVLLFLTTLAISGCQQSTTAETTSGRSGDTSELSEPGANSPLTQAEIHTFLSVLKHLPNQQVPSFSETVLPRLTSTERLDSSVARLRLAIRDAVTPERQVQEWESDPQLQRAFAEQQVNPVVFARLMLKISCAWSAWSVQQKASMSQANRQLDARTTQLMTELQNPHLAAGAPGEQELLLALEELIGLSEFMGLLNQVPEESLHVVAAAQQELRQVLPTTSLAQEFASLVESQSAILRTSASTPAQK